VGNSIRAGGLRFGRDFGSGCGCSVRKIALGGGEKLEETA